MYKLIRLLLLALILGLSLTPARTEAQELDPFGTVLSQDDLNGDGQIDRTVLSLGTSDRGDQAIVYDGGGDMGRGDDWRKVTDFTNDTWLFDRLGDGKPQVVVRFSQRDGSSIAHIYADQTGDAAVALTIDGAAITITETPYPLVTVEAEGDWLLPNGALNWNVRFLSDGSVRHVDTYDLTEIWNRSKRLEHDGQPDAVLSFGDRDRDGVPEYGIWRLLAPTPPSEGSMRSWIWSNEGQKRPAAPDTSLFWPYLALAAPLNEVKDGRAQPQERLYFDRPAQVEVNLNGGIVSSIAFRGYPIEAGFHMHNLEYLEPGRVNYASFENFQGYYDLDPARAKMPELHIRHRYFEPNDRLAMNLNTPANEIRWSWNQFGGEQLSWDYKVSLAGRVAMTEEVEVGGFRYRGLPYADWPRWASTQQWDYGTFVANEGPAYVSTEGIYEWGAVETEIDGDAWALSRMLDGAPEVDPAAGFQQIGIGLRGEFAPTLAGPPQLYRSPIDQKLHLFGAAHGVWSIDGQRELRYADLNHDGYIDQWVAASRAPDAGPPITTSQLYLTQGHLIFADADGVTLREQQIGASNFASPLPTDSASRQLIGGALAGQAPLDSPAAMFAGQGGPSMEIVGAQLRGYRAESPAKFQFILDFAEGYKVGQNDYLGLADRPPGSYLITYDRAFQIEPLVPAPPSIALQSDPMSEHAAGRLLVTLTNPGADDLADLTLELVAQRDSAAATLVLTQAISLAAGEAQQRSLAWAPPSAGAWQIAVYLRSATGREQAAVRQAIAVQPAQLTPDLLVGGARSAGELIAIVAPLLGAALLLGLLFGRTGLARKNEGERR